MDFWIWALIIGAPILAVLGWVFWLVVGWLAVKKAVQAATYQQNQLDQLLVQLDSALRAAAAAQDQRGGATPGAGSLTPRQQAELQTMWMQAQNRMADLDALSRQRYETRVSELSGMAASAGIDWTPPPY